MEQKNQFRTAGFGGFHRQDVLDYIERTAKEQAEKQAELTRSLEAAQNTTRVQAAKITYLELQLDKARQDLDEANAARESAELEKDTLAQQLAQVLEDGQSVEQLKQQLEDAKRQAEGYLQLKSDYAEIELDARQRASSQLSQAKSQAEEITAQAQTERDAQLSQARKEAADTIAQAQAQADTLLETARNQAEELLTQAQDEICRLQEERRHLLARTRRDFDTSSADLNVSVTAALREVECLRQSLLDLNTTFEENVHAVDELCGEGD
ncbi:MAG: hypothetical protein ACI3VN_05765 [Candidatus Onthomonas sp.]